MGGSDLNEKVGQFYLTINTICEMEHDLNNHANTFFTTAYSEYTHYISEIEHLLDGIGHGFPPLQDGERANDYIHRICGGE